MHNREDRVYVWLYVYVCVIVYVYVQTDRGDLTRAHTLVFIPGSRPCLTISSHTFPPAYIWEGWTPRKTPSPVFFLSPGASSVPLDFLGVHRSLPNKRKSNGTKLASHSCYLPNPRPLYSAIIPCDNNDEILHNHAREGPRSY